MAPDPLGPSTIEKEEAKRMARRPFKCLILVLIIAFVCFSGLHAPSGSVAAHIENDPTGCQSPTSLEVATPAASPPSAAAVATPSATLVSPVADIPLPGGATRFDYQSF